MQVAFRVKVMKSSPKSAEKDGLLQAAWWLAEAGNFIEWKLYSIIEIIGNAKCEYAAFCRVDSITRCNLRLVELYTIRFYPPKKKKKNWTSCRTLYTWWSMWIYQFLLGSLSLCCGPQCDQDIPVSLLLL